MRVALTSGRALPGDVTERLLRAMDGAEKGEPFERAFGVTIGQSRRWTGPRAIRRAGMENLVIRLADLIGPRNGATARVLSEALGGNASRLPKEAFGLLSALEREYGAEVPRSVGMLTMILTRQTVPSRIGLSESPIVARLKSGKE